MRNSNGALKMIIESKRRLIEEMKKIENQEVKKEYQSKIAGLNIAIDILVGRY